VERLEGACDGPGWYYWDDEYPEEGVVGAFATREEAEAHAREAGYILAAHPAENPTADAGEEESYLTDADEKRIENGFRQLQNATPSDAPEQEIPGVEWDGVNDCVRIPNVPNGSGALVLRVLGDWLELDTRHGRLLARAQVRDTLVPLLNRFIATGKLAPEQAEKPKTHGFLVQAVAGAIGVKLDDVDRLIASGESEQAEKGGER
jgi:hypothetical protein